MSFYTRLFLEAVTAILLCASFIDGYYSLVVTRNVPLAITNAIIFVLCIGAIIVLLR